MRSIVKVVLVLLLSCCLVSKAAVSLSTLTGSIQYDITAIGDQNTWVITPTNPKATQILVIFTAMNMRQGEMRIKETSTNTILFNCASCESTLPPPMYSKTGSITIFSTAINGVGFRASSFTLQFFGVPIGPTNLLNNTYANFNMGAASIVPLLSNGVLPATTTQQWAVRTNTQIIFSFSSFNFPNDCSARIQIHNRLTGTSSSSLIFSGCRASDAPVAWFYSSTGVALVVVATSNQDSAVQFQLNYFSDATLYACGSIVQPALTTDTSMVIADGSLSTDLMQAGVSCTWQVVPAQNTSLSLVMNRVSLKSGSSVTVYDGGAVNSKVLWNAVGATRTVPPVITSTSTALYILYASDSSNAYQYRGFEGDYYANYIGSIGSGKGYTQLKMSSALDIAPPGDGTTHSPGVRYIWYIAPAESTGPITFAVQLLRLLQPGSTLTLLEGVTGNTGGDTGGIAQDYNIGSRTVLATYSGDQIPDIWVRTSGTSATRIFQSSNIAAPDENFKIAYYSDGPNYHCGFTTNPANIDLLSFILTDGSSSIESVYRNQLCQWKLNPRNGYAIMLVFARFHLFGGTLRICAGSALTASKLYVEIGDTAAPPAPILIADSSLSLEYTTSNVASGYGFSMTYYAVNNSRSFPGDNVVTLHSSSVIALSLPLDAVSSLAPSTNLTWLIRPSGASGRIYFAISLLNLAIDCDHSYLDVYDGVDDAAPLLARYCGHDLPQPYSWLQTSASTARVQFKTDANVENAGNFQLAYFSDGPNFHCGFAVNPARMTAPSMVFSDGSGSASPLYRDQLCEWVIEPNTIVASAPAPSSTVIVVEFMLCDLAGAKIELFDGASDSASLLWSCDGCNNNPGPLISTSSKVFVRFTSYSEATSGQGFQLMYWTASAASLARSTALVQSHVLYLPSDFTITTGALNTSAAYFLGTTTTPASLFFHPFYGASAGAPTDVSASARDGRASPSVFEIPASQQSVCGTVWNIGNNRLVDETLTYTAKQRLGSFLTSTAGSKSLTSLHGVDRDPDKSYETQRQDSYFSLPLVCKYRLDSGSLQAVAIEISDFRPQQNGHLRVYGGLDSQDALLFDSNFPDLYLRWPSKYVSRVVDGVWVQSVNITAPCGQATIVVENNSTDDGAVPDNIVDYSLHLIYYAIAVDSGQKCSDYIASLQPSEKKNDPTVTILVVVGTVGAAGLIFAIFFYANKLKATQGYLLYPYGLRPTATKKKIVRAVPAHPRYSPQWDQYLNRFLRKGECCVCKHSTSVVLRLRCGHALCLEDLRGFLEAALGDISMFPLKCPMHFQGCTGLIDARAAKRVLTEPQYNRFNEFSDRAAYGDGMRCIFCFNYVNFPESMEHVSRVVCPYCTQNFCVRCKKTWHGGVSCAVDTYDPSLEVWKTSSGAQKCPACKKLIEKDDPDTCNHMVHKITDGIPCIRDRTDFCYCCGEEVAPDYPHNEVSGINHFPDGVFQRCRRIVMKEKEAERERLRKARRMKTKIVPIGRSSGGAAGGTDSPVLSPLVNPSGSFSAGSPGGDGSMEAMWLLEQQYDIEAAPFGSPSRPIPRSVPSTPAMSPSPTRVYPIAGAVDSGFDSPGGTHTTMRASPSSSGRFGSAVGSSRVVPASGVYTTTIPNGIAAGGSSRSATNSPVRAFPNLEQQMMYQHNTMLSTRGSGTSLLHASASTPQLLLGSPQQQRTRFTPSGRPTIV